VVSSLRKGRVQQHEYPYLSRDSQVTRTCKFQGQAAPRPKRIASSCYMFANFGKAQNTDGIVHGCVVFAKLAPISCDTGALGARG
jgi:hypothetical protein